jgi:predicted DNA-binding mobile mystery protein A
MNPQASIARRHLDQRFGEMSDLTQLTRPSKGWIRAIRESLGLTLEQFGKRLGVSKQRAIALEQQEVKNSLTLASLERAAQALGCRLVYAVVPNESLQSLVELQAQKKANSLIKQANQTMRLEDQATRAEEYEIQRQKLIDELLQGNLSRLWDEPKR